MNANYVGPRIACLPETVTLVPGDLTIQEQIFEILKSHSVKLIQLFREWDRDGNGALDRKEFHRAIGCLGAFFCTKVDIDALFDLIDASGDGHIDFGEMKRALNAWSSGRPAASPRHAPSGGASLSAQVAPKRVAPSVVIKEVLREVEMVMMATCPRVLTVSDCTVLRPSSGDDGAAGGRGPWGISDD